MPVPHRPPPPPERKTNQASQQPDKIKELKPPTSEEPIYKGSRTGNRHRQPPGRKKNRQNRTLLAEIRQPTHIYMYAIESKPSRTTNKGCKRIENPVKRGENDLSFYKTYTHSQPFTHTKQPSIYSGEKHTN
jgi:hypothetical protein